MAVFHRHAEKMLITIFADGLSDADAPEALAGDVGAARRWTGLGTLGEPVGRRRRRPQQW